MKPRSYRVSNILFGVVWGSLLLATVVALTGCGQSDPRPVAENIGGEVRVPKASGRVTMIRLPDGTRCALLAGHSRGGLSCDWRIEL